MRGLGKIFMFWVRTSNEYDRIKSDPEKRAKSVSMGVQSLILSILGTVLTVASAVGAFACFSSGTDSLSGLLLLFLGIILALAALSIFIEMVLASIVYAVYQMKLNKRAIGVVALVINLLLIVIAAILIVIFLTKL